MTNLRRDDIHGWLILNKPSGISSTKALGVVKSILKIKKAGHCGTLDPLASGVLPLALGEATKASNYILNSTKSYVFDVNWGVETSTGDLEGEVINTSNRYPSQLEVKTAINSFLGKSLQVPPIYSAIKVNGQPAYKLARSGKEFKLKSREIFVKSFKLLGYDSHSSKLEVICSKGTYVRSLAADLGRLMNTYGHITSLHRNFAGPFGNKDSFSLDYIRNLSHSGKINSAILPLHRGLDDILAITVEEGIADKLRLGQKIETNDFHDEVKVLVVTGDKPVAIAEIANGFINPKRVFNIY